MSLKRFEKNAADDADTQVAVLNGILYCAASHQCRDVVDSYHRSREFDNTYRNSIQATFDKQPWLGLPHVSYKFDNG